MAEHDEKSVAEARHDFADVLNAAIQGEPTIITNRGRPVAVIGPLSLLRDRDEPLPRSQIRASEPPEDA